MKKAILACGLLVLGGLNFNLCQADEIRVGLSYQDVSIDGLGGIKGKEESNGLSLDYVSSEITFLDFALKPKAYVGGVVNLSGNTSYGGGGLVWDTKLTGDLIGEISFGAAVHNGNLEIPTPGTASSMEEALKFEKLNAENIEFGSRVLFRTQFAIGYDIDEQMKMLFYYDHLSHGNILSQGSNEGLEAFGVRIGHRF